MKVNFLLSVILSVGLVGCSGVVKKPAAYDVKKIAIISLYSNHGVYNVSGGGGLTEGISALGSMVGNDKVKEMAAPLDFGGDRLISYSLNVFEKEFNKVNGWKVKSGKKVTSKRAYKKFMARMKKHGRAIASLNKLGESLWKSPKGMKPYLGHHNTNDGSPETVELAKLAKSLKVDAVAVVRVDLGYAPYTAVGGTGTASASVASTIKVVTANGAIAVLTPDFKRGQGQRHRSEETTALIGGNIRFNDEVESMYKEAIKKSAQGWRETIVKELGS